MLSPRAAKLIVKHLDGIDALLSSKLLRKRTWQEPALNTLFCDLLDEDVQHEEKLAYTIADLNRDLNHAGEPQYVSLEIETHQYPADLECYVNQADLGMILSHNNQFDPLESWQKAWLLQGKRMVPDQTNPPVYSAASRFQSYNTAQHKRMIELDKKLGGDVMRYLLYTPRPEYLDEEERKYLSYQRTRAVGSQIFDYTLGLQLHDDLLSDNSTIAAGVYLAALEPFPYNLGKLHMGIFSVVEPFAWFILSHFMRRRDVRTSSVTPSSGSIPPLLDGIVRGKHDIVRKILQDQGVERDFPVFPAHTIRIGVTTGADLPRRHND